ncbi:MAG: T9SS type A sorting domain-containing protein [Sphingobacteriales bacterium]|nr:MAG: T9SS type A sorting domain-containing protein [Sphingobacteriales bacterium]
MKQKITLNIGLLKTIICSLAIVLFSVQADAQILGWDTSSLSGTFGPSPFTPVIKDANITTSGLVRGSSISTSGSPAGGCWGGSGGWNTNGLTSDNSSFHFTVVATTGYKVSISSITSATRRSNSGPTGYVLYYSVDGGAFVSAGTVITTVSSGTVGTPGSTSLSDIPALQNVAAGKIIKFRINPTGSTGNYYLTGGDNALKVNGTVEPAATPAPIATAATTLTTAGFTANWQSVNGATGYRLDVATDAAFTEILEDYDNIFIGLPNLSQYVSSGILPNTIYYYRVRAEQGAHISAYSNVITVQVPECGTIALPGATAMAFCGTGTVADLSATGTSIKWYNSATGGDVLLETTALTTGNYYVSQTLNGCESERLEVAITVNMIPDAPEAAAQMFCGSGLVSGLMVTTGTAPKWYPIATGGDALAGNTALVAGNYYVSQTVNGCESARTQVAVTINEIPELPTASAQAFCGAASVSNLIATSGTATKWYTAATGGEQLADDVMLETGTYYLSQTLNGCESERASVAITINMIPDAPTATAQTFCAAGSIGDLMADGSATKWYNLAAGGEELTDDAQLANGIYYVSQTTNNCESERTAVVVTINEIPAVPTAIEQEFCGGGTVEDLTVTTGTQPKWYLAMTGGDSLATAATLATGNYYVSQTVDGCESERTLVAVTVKEIPAAPAIADNVQSFCAQASLADIITGGENIVWYSSATGGTSLENTTALSQGTAIYYAAQVVNGCESEMRTAMAVTLNMTSALQVNDQIFCTAGLVSELEANGTGVQWYAAQTGGEVLDGTAALESGNYYVSQTMNGCESLRTEVAVTITIADMPTGAQSQDFTEGQTLADLEVTGDNITWYSDEAMNFALPAATLLTTGTIYYAVQMDGDCTSDSLAITVTEILSAPGFELSSLKYYPNPVTDKLNIGYSGEISSVVIYNMVGQQVLNVVPNANSTEINTASLTQGTYICRITSRGTTGTVKIIKQ